jgi:uncharacterized membrane protein
VNARIEAWLNWLDPARGRIRFEPAPGVGRIDGAIVALFVPMAVLSGLILTAPLALPPGTTGDLSGAVGTVDNAHTTDAMPAPWNWVYGLGDVACHQRADRSFSLGGNQMPFCSRDLAIYVMIAVGLGACALPRSRAARAAVLMPWWGYFVLLAPIAVDGGAQAVLGWESDHLRRLITGGLAGLAVALALAFIVYEGRFAWDRAKRRRAASRGQGEGAGRPSLATGSEGLNEVDSAPTE